MKINKLLILSVLAVTFLGCGKREPRHIVILPDVSGSIDRDSLEQALKAIDQLARHLQRGDRLTIIPILGDAEAEASGKILRFEVPANRQAYDTDLRDFQSKLNFSLKKMQGTAIAHPGSKTDILGSLSLVQQEFYSYSTRSTKLLIILSDFIQDDNMFNFRTNSQLADRFAAHKFASYIATSYPTNFNQIKVYAGLLRSSEYASMPLSRRQALRIFWIQYFQLCGADPAFTTDGLEGLNIH